ncbi:MAG: DUF3592 domain-containing protein [Tepidisphaera sp.]
MSPWRREDRESDNETAPLGVFGTFVLSVAIGVILSFLWVGELRRVAAAPGWPTVDGRVTAASVYSPGTRGESFSVIADIEYVVNGEKRQQGPIRIVSEVSRDEALAKLPARGAPMKVWYDPSDPDRISLTADWMASHSIHLGILIACWSLAAITFPILVWRFRKATQGVLYGLD